MNEAHVQIVYCRELSSRPAEDYELAALQPDVPCACKRESVPPMRGFVANAQFRCGAPGCLRAFTRWVSVIRRACSAQRRLHGCDIHAGVSNVKFVEEDVKHDRRQKPALRWQEQERQDWEMAHIEVI
jgi:hypothetical protein